MPEIDRTYRTSRTINLGGGQKVELHHVAPGDGVGTTIVRVKPSNVAFSVDLYQPNAFVVSEFKEDTNFVGLRLTLNEMLAWDPSYVINGHMVAGFALMAWPAEYHNSGIMTFVVNQDGIVYERDLGPNRMAYLSLAPAAFALKAHRPCPGLTTSGGNGLAAWIH